jgi:lipid II:glycine glycyltransferase (peptidoglycan interpeptide bridge formation enzyme)
MLIIHDRIAYLPYGGSLDDHRNLKPTYTIVWETLKWLKSQGIEGFDFYGIEPDFNDNDGFSSYKTGFGGEIITYQDSFNLILKPLLYPYINGLLKIRENFDFLKRI